MESKPNRDTENRAATVRESVLFEKSTGVELAEARRVSV
jgi:hypothetical protein